MCRGFKSFLTGWRTRRWGPIQERCKKYEKIYFNAIFNFVTFKGKFCERIFILCRLFSNIKFSFTFNFLHCVLADTNSSGSSITNTNTLPRPTPLLHRSKDEIAMILTLTKKNHKKNFPKKDLRTTKAFREPRSETKRWKKV